MKKAISFMILTAVLLSVFSVTAFAQSAPGNSNGDSNTIEVGGCTVVINDVELQSMSETELTSVLQKVMYEAEYGVKSARSAESDQHSCSPNGPYFYKYGGWNYVLYSDGTPWYDFRLVKCISSSCTYSGTQYRYH